MLQPLTWRTPALPCRENGACPPRSVPPAATAASAGEEGAGRSQLEQSDLVGVTIVVPSTVLTVRPR